MNDPILKEKAVQILNTFSEEQLAAFITLFGKPDGGEPPIEESHAEKCGKTLNSFINRAIDETIERDNKEPPEKE